MQNTRSPAISMERVPTELSEEAKSQVNVEEITLNPSQGGPGVTIEREKEGTNQSQQMQAIEAQKKALFFGGVVFGIVVCGGSYLAWMLFKKMKETPP